MKKLFNSKLLLQVIVASMVATMATAGIVGAATTIGSNINTAGTLTATGATVIYGATSIGGALTATSTLSVASLATLLGGATTTSITLLNGETISNTTDGVISLMGIASTTSISLTNGETITNATNGAISFNDANLVTTGTLSAAATTLSSTLGVTGVATFSDNIKVAPAYGLDVSSAGVLNIGTTTATSINIGKSGVPAVMANASSTLANFGGGTTVSGLLHGTCTVDFGILLDAGMATTTNCTATGVSSAYKVFVTPSNLENSIAFNSASSTDTSVIQIQVFNTSTSTPATMASHTWSWMAIK